MKRDYCTLCQRPQIACICHCVDQQTNTTHVVILQHPSEVNRAKGSVDLLKLSLSSCQVIVGENFDQCPEFQAVLQQYTGHLALLYPSEKAITVDTSTTTLRHKKINCLVLLDGTWKKAYRLYMLNRVLNTLPHLALSADIVGHYSIRKTNKSGALSTLEACCHALTVLEDGSAKYQKILQGFIKFNQLHLLFRDKK